MARSARNDSVPDTSRIGAGRTWCQASCGIAAAFCARPGAAVRAATRLLSIAPFSLAGAADSRRERLAGRDLLGPQGQGAARRRRDDGQALQVGAHGLGPHGCLLYTSD